jgi:hypothetical protein
MTLHTQSPVDYSWEPRNNDHAPVTNVSPSGAHHSPLGDDAEFEAIFLYVEATFPKTIAYLAK